MNRKLLKISPLAALLVASYSMAEAQDVAGKAATAEATGAGQKPETTSRVANSAVKTKGEKPRAKGVETAKKPAPATEKREQAPPVADKAPPVADKAPPVAAKAPRTNHEVDTEKMKLLLASPFTQKQDPVSSDVEPVALAGISLVADTRNKAEKDPKTFEAGDKEKLGGGVVFDGGLHTPERAGLHAALGKYISAAKPATFQDLQDMVGIIEEHYRKHHRPMTHVYIPKQTIYSDKVVISIVEGRVGELAFRKKKAHNTNWWDSWYATPYKTENLSAEMQPRASHLQGRIVDTEEIQAQITGFNRSPWVRMDRPVPHPFRDVSVSFSQPAANVVGTTNLTFEVDEKRPLKFFAGVDNSLSEQTGTNRMFLGGAWYDALGLGKDHEMGIQFFSALKPTELEGLSLNYQIPWKDRGFSQFTELFAAYATSTTSIMFGAIPTDVGGTSSIIGGRHYLELPGMLGATELTQPLGINHERTWLNPIREPIGIHHEVGLGMDFKQMDNNLQFGGTQVASSPAEVFQVVLEYNARQTDPTGETGLGAQLFMSPGGVGSNNNDKAFNPLRKDAKAAYVYTRIRLDREQDLPFTGYFQGMMLKGALTAQYASVNLLASEQMGLGGYGSVRGYPERPLRGDIGGILNLELYSPEYHPAKEWLKFAGTESFKCLVFVDYAHGTSVKNSVSDPLDNPADLVSVGVGMRYDINDLLRIRCDYGMRLKDLPVAANNTDSGAIHFGLVCTF